MTVLEDLWYGNIAPSEQFLSDNLHFKKLVSSMAKSRDVSPKVLPQSKTSSL